MRVCSNCGATGGAETFYCDRSRPDGLSQHCRACILVARTAYRAKNRAALRDRARADRAVNLYGTWRQMIERCSDPDHTHFHRYGGRGIRVCDRWLKSQAAFDADMGPRPTPRHTVDRIDNNGHYEPGNCRWATPIRQGNNTNRNRRLAAFGRTQTLSEWARERGVSVGLIKDRLDVLGWSTEDAISRPPNPRSRPRRTA